jgi:hypothetical protein
MTEAPSAAKNVDLEAELVKLASERHNWEEGLTPAEYVALEDKNPDAFPQTYQEGMRTLVKRVKGGPKKAGDNFFRPDAVTKPHPDNVARARARAKKSRGTDADHADILAALFGIE